MFPQGSCVVLLMSEEHPRGMFGFQERSLLITKVKTKSIPVMFPQSSSGRNWESLRTLSCGSPKPRSRSKVELSEPWDIWELTDAVITKKINLGKLYENLILP